MSTRNINDVISPDSWVAGPDGYFMFWPATEEGGYSSVWLRKIADELDRRNEAWEEQVQNYFKEPNVK